MIWQLENTEEERDYLTKLIKEFKLSQQQIGTLEEYLESYRGDQNGSPLITKEVKSL